MAYVFNNGYGGVVCDRCRILYDSNLSYQEYTESYKEDEEDLCYDCFQENQKRSSLK